MVGITTAYRFFNEPLAELIAAKLPASVSPIATFINESANAADPAFIGLGVGFITYWIAGEPWSAMGKELFTMGLKNFFQTARQDAIDQLVTERADKLASELAEQMATNRVAEARAQVRIELLQELRKMSPEDIKAMLEQETPPASHNGNGHS